SVGRRTRTRRYAGCSLAWVGSQRHDVRRPASTEAGPVSAALLRDEGDLRSVRLPTWLVRQDRGVRQAPSLLRHKIKDPDRGGVAALHNIGDSPAIRRPRRLRCAAGTGSKAHKVLSGSLHCEEIPTTTNLAGERDPLSVGPPGGICVRRAGQLTNVPTVGAHHEQVPGPVAALLREKDPQTVRRP